MRRFVDSRVRRKSAEVGAGFRGPGPLRGRFELLAGLIAAGLAAVAISPVAAGAATRGFHVFNLSSFPLMLNGTGIISGDFSGGHPAPNSVLQPGVGYDDWEQTYVFGSTTNGELTYSVRNNGVGIGTFNPFLQIYSINTNQVYCKVDLGACNPEGTDYVDGSDVDYEDPPGTVHNIPTGQGELQAQTLKQFCAEDNSATCTFTPISETHVDTPSHQVGGSVANNTDTVKADQTISIQDTVGSTDSVGVDVKVGGKIAKVVDVSVTAHYSHEWLTSHTFTQDIHTDVPAHTKVWVDATQPMLRDTGNFVFTLGNTTWNLYGVYFDSPDPTGNPGYVIESAPLTSAERRQALPPLRGPQVLRGSYKLPTSAGVGAIGQPKLHLSIAGPRSVAAGQLASYRITLSRSQPNHLLAYALKNIQVVGSHAGHRVRHFTLASLPRGKSRILRLSVKVPDAQRSFCVAVSATASHALAARAQTCSAEAAASPPTGGLG